jgi:hypothetical protein
MSQKTMSAFDLDIRVRDRHLKSGALSEKDVEKFLTALPDLADAAEPVSLAQPALAQPEEADDEDEDDGDGDEGETPASEPG